MEKCRQALVVGGSRGIGESIVKKLIGDGWSVDFTFNSTAPDLSKFHQAEGSLEVPRTVRAHRCDVSSESEISELKAKLEKQNVTYDGFVYCAGITADALLANFTPSTAKHLFDVNFWGFALTFKAVYPFMNRTGGRIVAVGSAASKQTFAGNGIYAASKAALAALVRSIATENGRRGLTANCIEPGFISTDMTATYSGKMDKLLANVPAKRAGTASEVSSLVAYLLSDSASYINGESIAIDGGMSSGMRLIP